MKFNKNKKIYCIIILICLAVGLFKVYSMMNGVKKAKFINISPSVILNETEYIVTEELLEESKLEKKPIAKITDIETPVSYLEQDNPYKHPNRIYKIRDTDIESKIAIEMNDQIYLAIEKESGHN